MSAYSCIKLDLFINIDSWCKKPRVKKKSHVMIHQLTTTQRALGQVINTVSVSWVRRLVSDFSPQSPGFNSVLVHVKLMVDEMVLGQGFSHQYRCIEATYWYKPHENCALLGYCGDSSGSFLPTIQNNLSFPSSVGFLTSEDGTDRFVRSVGNKLRLLAA